MTSLYVAIVALTFLVIVSSAFLSDGILKVNFTKIQDESDEYDFELAQKFYMITSFIANG